MSEAVKCTCGHQQGVHAGEDSTGRCIHRSCGCGKFTPKAAWTQVPGVSGAGDLVALASLESDSGYISNLEAATVGTARRVLAENREEIIEEIYRDAPDNVPPHERAAWLHQELPYPECQEYAPDWPDGPPEEDA